MIFIRSTILTDAQESSDKQSLSGKRFATFGNSPSDGGFDLFRMRQQRQLVSMFIVVSLTVSNSRRRIKLIALKTELPDRVTRLELT
jgi:hypothetical protein